MKGRDKFASTAVINDFQFRGVKATDLTTSICHLDFHGSEDF